MDKLQEGVEEGGGGRERVSEQYRMEGGDDGGGREG